MRRIVFSGASGLIGRKLAPFLASAGYEVRRLVRRPAHDATEIAWEPARDMLDGGALEGVDAVIHLSGASVTERRWSSAVKEEIRASRVDTTRLVAETLSRLQHPPKLLACASGASLYDDRTGQPAAEESPERESFLTGITREWEAAADPARAAGIRVVHLRLGAVVSRDGGILARMLPIFRAGLGGPIGSGRQGISWIAMEDVLAIAAHVLADNRLSGPVNTVAPHPVSQAEFAQTLARVLRRPAALPLPAPAVRLMFGQMGEEVLLRGPLVLPAKLERAGYRFRFPDLEEAIRAELG